MEKVLLVFFDSSAQLHRAVQRGMMRVVFVWLPVVLYVIMSVVLNVLITSFLFRSATTHDFLKFAYMIDDNL